PPPPARTAHPARASAAASAAVNATTIRLTMALLLRAALDRVRAATALVPSVPRLDVDLTRDPAVSIVDDHVLDDAPPVAQFDPDAERGAIRADHLVLDLEHHIAGLDQLEVVGDLALPLHHVRRAR